MNNFRKYLPSKKFVTTVISILILIGLFFLVKGAISLLKNRKSVDKNGAPIPMTVGTIIQKDSNYNGIADWEEYLWGLDPNKNGPENKEFILAKKKELQKDTVILAEDDSKTITQNDMLSRQFFATIMALQQTGDLDDEAIASISESIGEEIKTAPIPDVYTVNMLTVKGDSEESVTTYFNDFSKLVNKYSDKDIGTELTIISQGIVNKDPQALYAAQTIASAYRDFGKELIKIPVPNKAINVHLSLANNYEKTAQSIEGLAQVLTDPLIGMRSMLNYKKYSDALVADLKKF